MEQSELEELREIVETLRSQIARMLEDPTLSSMANGAPLQAFGVVHQSPLNPRLRYALVREAGGGAKFVLRSTLTPVDWSDA